MEDDCIIVSAHRESPGLNGTGKGRSSPTTPASGRKLVQARLPFKPLLSAQCGNEGSTAKKRKLIDSNANFQPAKNIKTEESTGEEACEQIIADSERLVTATAELDAGKIDEVVLTVNSNENHSASPETRIHDDPAAVAAVHDDPAAVHSVNLDVSDSSEYCDTASDEKILPRSSNVDFVPVYDVEVNTPKDTFSSVEFTQDSPMEVSCCEEGANLSSSAMSESQMMEKRKSLDKKVATLKKEEKERLKAVERERKEKEKEEARLKKLQERKEREMEKEKEKAEREKEKAEKKKQKEDEKLRKQEQLLEEKKKKEDEKLRKQEQLLEEKKKREEAKLEEKKKKEEKKEKVDDKVCLVKEIELMQKFFVKSTKDTAMLKTQNDVKSGPFMEFQVKENMRLAPVSRLEPDAACQSASNLDIYLHNELAVDVEQLYLQKLKSGSYHPKRYAATWPSQSLRGVGDVLVVPSNKEAASCFMRAKLFQFHDNYRPAYYGTWRKHSKEIRPRNPWRLDKQLLDYEVDSDEEWEEEEPGESLSHSELDDDDEDDAEPDEDNDGFFVPHGYLSESEGCEDDDDDDQEKGSPGKLKARQLAKARNWEAELRCKKYEVLQPIVIGICWWTPETTAPDPVYNKLREFQIQLFDSSPISTTLTSDVSSKAHRRVKPEHKNIIWLPVPDSALSDLARLVHGNESSIKKLIREFCEFWRSKTYPEDSAVAGDEKQSLLSKRQLEAKIRQIAVYESRPEYPRRKLWYINADIIDKLNLSPLPVPTEWKWMTKSVKS